MSHNSGHDHEFKFPAVPTTGKYKWMWISAGVLVVAGIILIAFFNH